MAILLFVHCFHNETLYYFPVVYAVCFGSLRVRHPFKAIF